MAKGQKDTQTKVSDAAGTPAASDAHAASIGSPEVAVDFEQTIGLLGGRSNDMPTFTLKNRMARIQEMLGIVRRYDVLHGITPTGLRHMLEELGPTFVKAGQILSMRSEILPEAFCSELAKLRTDVEPMSEEEVLQVLRAEYDRPLEELFSQIDPNPLGSASVAQVHRATLASGEDVAIKVQRPGVLETMAQDIDIIRSLAGKATHVMQDDQFIDLMSVVEELWQSFKEETDFLVEAKSLDEFRHNNESCAYVECPEPHLSLCTKHVVVMDYVEGIPISRLGELRQNGYDLEEIGIKLIDNYTQQMLEDGFFHGDPHPGNIIISGGKIVYIDLGIMGRLSSHDRSCLKDMVAAVAAFDSSQLKDGLLRFSSVDVATVDHAQLLADLDAIVADYGTADLAELNIGAFLNALITLARRHGIELPGTVTMLARSMVTLEGVANRLMPSISMIDIISTHLRAHADPVQLARDSAKLAGKETIRATRGMLGAASQADLAMRMLTRGQLRVNVGLEGSADPIEELSRVVNRLAVGIIVAGLFIGSSVVYYARIKPVIFGIPVIGFVGYVVALVLGIRVVASIMKEDRSSRRH